MKSLGTIRFPKAEITGVSFHEGTVELTITGSDKRLTVKMGIHCARRLVDIAREIAGKQRGHALEEWHRYENLRDYTGYKAPNGEK